jgi:uncharacterized protein (DUF2235 family)
MPDQVDEETNRRHATNVTKVARAIRPTSGDVQQVVYYHDGVGTHKGLNQLTGGAFGEGIEDNIRDLYRFLVYNYADGDEIYLFGFSRGAFTVRTLAGFMNRFGLLHKSDDFFVPDLFQAYKAGRPAAQVRADPHFKHMNDPQACPPITFVGVWDTVGALGAPGPLAEIFNGSRYKYHDVELNSNIKNGFHALAIDEHRMPFKPSIWVKPPGWQGNLEQVWFTGVHCNVGGGYSPDGLANEALHWLVGKAEHVGLEFNCDYLKFFRPCFNSNKNESMTSGYRVLGVNLRSIGEHRDAGEAVHQSVIDRLGLAACDYSAENLKAELTKGPTALPVAQTTRDIARGTPCGSFDDQANAPK